MRADLTMVNGTLIRWIALSGTDGLSSMYVRFCSEKDEGRQTRILAVHVDAHPVPGVLDRAVFRTGLCAHGSRLLDIISLSDRPRRSDAACRVLQG